MTSPSAACTAPHAESLALMTVRFVPLPAAAVQMTSISTVAAVGAAEGRDVVGVAVGVEVLLDELNQLGMQHLAELLGGGAEKAPCLRAPERLLKRIEPLLEQGQATAHHGGIEMASPTGGDRDHGNADGFEALGIELGRHVALQNSHLQCLAELWKRSLE